MKPADHKGEGEFPEHPCERMTAHDIQPTNPKLGHLWAWDRQTRRPVYKILTVKDVHETKAIMPYWQEGTAKWSISTGVYENKFLMNDRTCPPRQEMPVLGARAATLNCLVITVVKIP